MNNELLAKLQSERGTKTVVYDTRSKSANEVLKECRAKVQHSIDRYRNLDPQAKKSEIRSIIIEYVLEAKPCVPEHMNGDQPDINSLTDWLINSITSYGILSNAMEDPDVFEIRSNGKEVKIEKGGRVQDLKDDAGRILSFETPEEQEVVLQRLVGDGRYSPSEPLKSVTTLEGYRVALVHTIAVSNDPLNPEDNGYHSFVLRKFKTEKMRLGTLVGFGTMSDNMARLMTLTTAGGLTFFTVGPTASGKTTTNNAILQSTPDTTRTVLIQNPSEIDIRKKDPSTGRVYNDVLHLEASHVEKPTPSSPTMENLMDQTLRLSPTFVSFGELRTNAEFKTGMKVALAGHPFNCTYHADNSYGAISRFLTAYLAESGNEPSHLALQTITSIADMIIVQKILRDGKRKVIQITEILGIDPNNVNMPLLNDIYRFEIDEEPEYDEKGNVTAIHGKHVRVGKISKRLQDKFKIEGVPTSRYDFLLHDVLEEPEIETYTGKNIEHYGLEMN